MISRIRIHAVPNARRTEVAGRHGDAVKIKIAACPEDGRANEELVRFLAGSLGVARSAVRLKSGASSREKVVEVDVANAEAALLDGPKPS